MVMTRLKRRMIGHFHPPHGLGGRVAGWVMAHRDSNRRRNVWVVELLDVQPEDRVLEVGFGPGIALGELAARGPRGPRDAPQERAAHPPGGGVYGIDRSGVMGERASRRTRARAGRIELIHA